MDIRIRDAEACAPDADLAWDSVWVQRLDASGGYADWILAGPDDQPDSRGGLRAESGLHTATLICLFTDRRRPDTDKSALGANDPRGWWGDTIKLAGEPAGETGSLLWTLIERGIVNEDVRRMAERHARDALATLATQGAVARTDVAAEIDPARGYLGLHVQHWSHAGDRIYEQRFERLWRQMQRPAPMNTGDARF